MKITDIAKAKGDRYNIYIDNEYWNNLDIEIVMVNGFAVGKEIDEDLLEDVLYQSQRRKARERAYYLIGYRDHSKKELYDKLLLVSTPEISLDIVEMLQEQGLIDDEKYAGRLARNYLQNKRWGAKKAAYEMSRKGIDKEIIQSAIDDCDIDYVSQIKGIIDKKYYDCLDDYKDKQKLIGALMRLGHSYDNIKAAMNEYIEERL